MKEGKAAVEARSVTSISVEESGRSGQRPSQYEYLGGRWPRRCPAIVCVGLAGAAHQEGVVVASSHGQGRPRQLSAAVLPGRAPGQRRGAGAESGRRARAGDHRHVRL